MLKWDEKMSVNIKEIDAQHKKLIDVLNGFYLNLGKEDAKKNLDKLLDDLEEYTITHFSTEEKYMKNFNFYDYEEHKKQHSDFVNKIKDAKKRISEGRMVLSLEITNSIKDWLVTHIMGTDRKYIKCFNDNGLK